MCIKHNIQTLSKCFTTLLYAFKTNRARNLPVPIVVELNNQRSIFEKPLVYFLDTGKKKNCQLSEDCRRRTTTPVPIIEANTGCFSVCGVVFASVACSVSATQLPSSELFTVIWSSPPRPVNLYQTR